MNALIENFYDNSKPLKTSNKIDITHFSLICVIGQGSYAKVLLSRKKDTGKIYALKVLKKNKIEQKNQKNHIKTERNVLIEMKHPFIIQMMYAFQNENKLYFALEYCPGGELFNLLQQKRQFKEVHARFYIVQILLAIQHLHKHDIIYRDLKPENVLIDKDGYIRLTDFGLSKKGIKGNKGAYSACGTPEYLAPEVLANAGHGKAVDWWTLGAIMFEMLTGLPPFYTPNREELFERIRFFVLKYPPYLTSEAKSLLEGLFIKDPNQRLGGGPLDAEEIMAHPWFKDVDWNAYLRKEVQPPFMPIIKNELDVSNFDPEFTDAPVSSFGASTMMESSQMYPGWSYNGQESLPTPEPERTGKMETEEFEIDEKVFEQ